MNDIFLQSTVLLYLENNPNNYTLPDIAEFCGTDFETILIQIDYLLKGEYLRYADFKLSVIEESNLKNMLMPVTFTSVSDIKYLVGFRNNKIKFIP